MSDYFLSKAEILALALAKTDASAILNGSAEEWASPRVFDCENCGELGADGIRQAVCDEVCLYVCEVSPFLAASVPLENCLTGNSIMRTDQDSPEGLAGLLELFADLNQSVNAWCILIWSQHESLCRSQVALQVLRNEVVMLPARTREDANRESYDECD